MFCSTRLFVYNVVVFLFGFHLPSYILQISYVNNINLTSLVHVWYVILNLLYSAFSWLFDVFPCGIGFGIPLPFTTFFIPMRWSNEHSWAPCPCNGKFNKWNDYVIAKIFPVAQWCFYFIKEMQYFRVGLVGYSYQIQLPLTIIKTLEAKVKTRV